MIAIIQEFTIISLLIAVEANKNHLVPYYNPRIIGGQNAEEGLAPYQISVQTLPGAHLCGGAIIAPQWILTAAHCVKGWPADLLRIAAGSNQYQKL